MQYAPFLIACVEAFLSTSDVRPESSLERSRSGLQVLYEFHASIGDLVEDTSNTSPPLHLRISEPDAVTWCGNALEIHGETTILSEIPAARIVEAVQWTNEFTLEAWLRPADDSQRGPARIVSISEDSGKRNVTLGQDGDTFEVRFRTATTNPNGLPGVATKSKTARLALTHVAYTRDRTGQTRLFLDGEQVVGKDLAQDVGDWDATHFLALGNEATGDRPWRGTFHLVALYNRALPAFEVARHFEAGPDAPTESAARTGPDSPFEREVAPILAKHCLECHDSGTRKGKLDLSRKDAAFAGGGSGVAIVPGSASESLLWENVATDEMPYNRPPLSVEEKERLRDWIDDGAEWTLDTLEAQPDAPGATGEETLVRRLTVTEYTATVHSATGVDIAKEARELLPPDLRADGFSNTAYNLGVDFGHIDAYAKLAERVVQRMDTAAFAKRFTDSRELDGDKMRDLIANMGAWLLRGPLEDHEIDSFRGITTTVIGANGDFEEVVSLIIQAMLQSPRFLYRIENQRGDGTAWPVSDHELASRLSYALWGAPPDTILLRCAEKGVLQRPDELQSQARRMIGDPRAVEHSLRFIHEWLNLDRLGNLRPNPERFPQWNAQVASDMREETLAFFKEIVWEQRRPLANLLNAQVVFATPRLAALYDLPVREEEGFARYDVSDIPARGGLLTQGSVLTMGGDEASTVARGLFLLRNLLRDNVGDPPPNLDTTPVPSRPGMSRRAVAQSRVSNPECGGCHGKFEPLAFAFEKYNGIGAYAGVDEHANVLREDGEILFPGAESAVPYETTSTLLDLLAGSKRVQESLTWKVAQFALGRPLTAADATALESIHARALENGGTYAHILVEIVTGDLMGKTLTEARP